MADQRRRPFIPHSVPCTPDTAALFDSVRMAYPEAIDEATGDVFYLKPGHLKKLTGSID